MKVTVVYVPEHVKVGHPPIWMFHEVHEYSDGTCITYGLRTIVWQNKRYLLQALKDVDDVTYNAFTRVTREVDVVPCLACCSVVAESDMAEHVKTVHAPAGVVP